MPVKFGLWRVDDGHVLPVQAETIASEERLEEIIEGRSAGDRRAGRPVTDAFGGRYAGEMRFLTGDLGTEQVAVTHRRMPPQTGSPGGCSSRRR
jgi:hypothetical protein